jgi:Asp-tRNA(Asn)/Glu-tRNA(Gln) amidotransferase A subunit family amidase
VSGFAEFEQYDALGLADLVRRRQVTPVELLEAAIERVEARNARVNAVVMSTVWFNLTGQPAMMLPLGRSAEGLPIAVQLVARHGDEATLFRLAGQLEKTRPWFDRKPSLAG